MATAISSISLSLFISAWSVSLFILLSLSNKGYALNSGQTSVEVHFHSLHVSSFLPATVCKPSATDEHQNSVQNYTMVSNDEANYIWRPPGGWGGCVLLAIVDTGESLVISGTGSQITRHSRKASSLKLVYKHGPCSHLKGDKAIGPTITQILSEDQSRVNSIHSRLNFNSGLQSEQDSEATFQANAGPLQDSEVTLPAKSGRSLGTGNYIVVVGLGKPRSDFSLVFDTGSDITWTQCQPCAQSCYKQQDKIFDPSLSTTYKNVSCTSPECSQLTSATGINPGCSGTTCVYHINYKDQSFSIGLFATETLTLTPTDVFPNFLFGCGRNNKGLFGGTAGLLGLGRDKLSLVSQTASKYGKYFSYCLPTQSSPSGHLTFGKGTQSNALKFTPLTVNPKGPSFYFMEVKGIKVGGQMLPISQSVFSTAGTIIDSGTVITRLPPAAYSAMRTTFRQQMQSYPMTQAVSILDTCYDLSNYTTVTVPKISFIFRPDVEVLIPLQGTVYGSRSQLCLAFAGNGDASDVGIFGNVQQQTLEVAYDVAGGSLGFGTGGCS